MNKISQNKVEEHNYRFKNDQENDNNFKKEFKKKSKNKIPKKNNE